MPKRIPSMKPRELIRLIESMGCFFYGQGKGDHTLYARHAGDQKRVAPVDMGQTEYSPAYVLRVLRQFGFTDSEINEMFSR